MSAALSTIRMVFALRLAWPGAALQALLDAERGRLMPWLAVFMAGGVVAYFSLHAEPPAYAGAALAGIAGLLCMAAWPMPPARMAALGLLAAASGFGSAQLATLRAPPVPVLPRTAAIVTGVVAGVEPRPLGRRVTLAEASLDGAPALSRVLHVTLRPADPAVPATGETIRVRTVLRPPAEPAYPGALDLQRDAFFSGLGGGGVALGLAELLVAAHPGRLAQWLLALREDAAARIMAGLPGPAGAIAATMLTGQGSAIPEADRAAFRDSGLAHLLAVAGLHIGIVMGLAMGATRFGLALWEHAALHWPCKQIAAVAALAAGLCYVLLTGMHVPVLRSFAMASLLTLGIATGRPAFSLRGLALAAIALMAVMPEAVMGVSFQMSFAAVLALIAGYEALRPALRRLYPRRLLHHLASLVLTSLLAGAASAPFGAYHFGRVQVYFILANLLAVPLTAAVIMPAGMAAVALLPFGLESVALVPMGWALDAVLWLAHAVAALPAATLGVAHIPAWGLAVLAFGLAWLCIWRTRLRLLGGPVLLAGLLSGWASPPADLLVSPDARLIAFRTPAAAQARPGASRFVQAAWTQYWAESLAAPFPETGGDGPIRCDQEGCRLQHGGAVVLLARSLRPMDCAGAVLVVSAEPAQSVCPGLPRIDRFAAWRDGAHAVWLRDGMAEILSDRAARGNRPWVPPPPSSRPAATRQPLALTE